MSEHGEGLEWRFCRYCNLKRYCSPSSMRDHEEDCNERPSVKNKMHLCPKCGSVLQRMKEGWLCVNGICDFQIGVLTGGKLQQ